MIADIELWVPRILLDGPKSEEEIAQHIRIRMRLLGYEMRAYVQELWVTNILRDLRGKGLVVPTRITNLAEYRWAPHKHKFKLREDYAKEIKEDLQR